MLAINIGPLALPVAPLLIVLALWLAALVGRTAATAAVKPALGNAVMWSALAGLVAARVAFVALEHELYRATPWALLDLRDGGYVPWAGAAAGVAIAALQGWRRPPLQRPLALGLAAGLLAWWAATAALGERERTPLPQLALTSLDGAHITLAALAQGQPMVVNLWATWCAPCRREMPVLAAAQAREPALRVVFVNQGETAPVVRSYLAASGLELRHVLLDPAARLGPALGSTGLPTTLFYDASGHLVERHLGALSAVTLASKMRPLRSQATAAPP